MIPKNESQCEYKNMCHYQICPDRLIWCPVYTHHQSIEKQVNRVLANEGLTKKVLDKCRRDGL